MFKNSRLKAFTLLEAMVSLLVISGSLLLFQALSAYLVDDINWLNHNSQREWLLFVDQLEAELEGAEFVKLEGNLIYIKKNGKDYSLGQSSKDDFRKMDDRKRGYQPLLFHLESSQVSQEESRIRLHVQFEDGLEREFIYAFAEKN